MVSEDKKTSESTSDRNSPSGKLYRFILSGAIVPKARARYGGKRAYLPKRYRDWKDGAILQLLSQKSFADSFPLEKVAVTIQLYGKLRGDPDNLAGAILDALVQSKIILDDRLSVVPELNVKHFPRKEKGAEVLISNLIPISSSQQLNTVAS